ncbi:hypothetical protein KKB43_05260 [Patescibacteria group bacterium]|nr:hypothetical protein [Patescibacteria group bacterium]MBU4580394.1 hypothetical protein [Patescibacteria group bacterium]
MQNKLWREYIHGKQTLKDLSAKYHRGKKWINQQLNSVKISSNNLPNPQPIVIIADVTFFERSYGIVVIREPNFKKNIYWKEVSTETPDIYWQARTQIEQQGFTLKGVVIDGKRGVKEVFLDLPVQMCQFHQVAIINRYLTRKPKLDAGKELRKIALALTDSSEKEFTFLLNSWYEKWKHFLQEKSINFETHKLHYTHKRLRSAYRSLKTNLPYLFTYQKHPELKTPNATNFLDGTFSYFKTLLRIHRGMSKAKRYKVICEILKN